MLEHLNMDDEQKTAQKLAKQLGPEKRVRDEIQISIPPDETLSSGASNRPFSFQEQPAPSQSSSKIFPNNTLVEDLSKCHENLKPELVRAARRFQDLVGACWPSTKFALIQGKSRNDTDQRPTQSQAGRNVAQRYRFEMPKSVARINSTLSADDYNCALSVLSGDMRFKLHLLLYNRIQSVWTLISTGVCVLVALLTFTTLTSVIMVAIWFASQMAGLLVCQRTRKRFGDNQNDSQLNRMLERSVAQVNAFFMDHNLMIGVINEGGLLTKSRFVVPMVFFDAFQCIEQIDSMVRRDLVSMQTLSDRDRNRQRDESQPNELETNQRVLARAQLAKKIVLDFSQRWISHFDKSKLLLSDEGSKPRHLSTGKCLCQFIEENLADEGDEPEVQSASNGIVEGSAKIHIWPDDDDLECEREKELKEQIEPLSKTYALSAMDLFQDMNQLGLIKTNDGMGRLSNIAAGFGHLHGRATADSSHGSEGNLSCDQDVSLHDQTESLFKNLRILFELRANELSKNNEASSMLDSGKSSPSELRLSPNSSAMEQDDKDDQHSSPGKRFFARLEGFSSVLPRRNKPEGLYASSPRQMLDIY